MCETGVRCIFKDPLEGGVDVDHENGPSGEEKKNVYLQNGILYIIYVSYTIYMYIYMVLHQGRQRFLKKIQNMGKIPQDSILMTTDVVGLYPSIPHNAGLKALRDALDCRQNKKIPTDMFSLTTTLSLGKKYSIKFLELLLA